MEQFLGRACLSVLDVSFLTKKSVRHEGLVATPLISFQDERPPSGTPAKLTAGRFRFQEEAVRRPAPLFVACATFAAAPPLWVGAPVRNGVFHLSAPTHQTQALRAERRLLTF